LIYGNLNEGSLTTSTKSIEDKNKELKNHLAIQNERFEKLE
tara:strand:- start:471 stop:593 length:123 start_codon:yes stop_codon:yes gene_type:complete